MSSADPPLTGHTVYLLSQLGRAGRRRLTAALALHDLTMRDMAALAVLDQTDSISHAELGRRLGLDPSDITALVDEMCSHGRVERTVDPADRRRRLIRATRSGRAALKTAQKITRQVDDAILEPLAPSLRAEIHDALASMLEHERTS